LQAFQGYDTLQLLELVAAIAASGVISGILAGLFGIGGGAILVPVFYWVLGLAGVDEAVRMHLAVGTSIGIILPTAVSSVRAHNRRGAVDAALLKSWLIAVPAGVFAATAVAAQISGAQLRGIFAVIAVIIALRMLLNRENWRLGSELPGNPARALVGAALGFVSTLMGIGGGLLNNTFMTLYGRPMHQAIGTSSGVGVLIAVPGILGYIVAGWGRPELPPLSLGFVNLIAVAVVVPITMVAAPFGVRMAHALSKRKLELMFGTYMLFVAAQFFYSLIVS
jgi:uncharacterized membrane protein YfcA